MFNIDPQKFLKSAFKQREGLKSNKKLDTKKGVPDSKPIDNSSNNSKLNKDGLNKDLNSKVDPKSSVKSDGTQKQLELSKDGKTTSTKSFKDARQAKMSGKMNDKSNNASKGRPKPARANSKLEDPGSPNSPKPNVGQSPNVDANSPEPSIPTPPATPKNSTPDISGNIPKSKFKIPSVPRMKVPKFKRQRAGEL